MTWFPSLVPFATVRQIRTWDKKCDRRRKNCTLDTSYGETGHGNFGTIFGLNIGGLNIGKFLPKTKTGFLLR